MDDMLTKLGAEEWLQSLNHQYSDTHHAKSILGKFEIIIYGYGAGFVPVFNTLINRLKLSVSYITDAQFSQDQDVDGYKALSLVGLTNLENKNKYVVIITIGNEVIAKRVEDELRSKGYENIVWAPDIYEYNIHHNDDGLDYARDSIITNVDAILAAYNLLADRKSRAIFSTLLEIYITHKPRRVSSEHPDFQYFPLDIFNREHYKNFINCGAYNGDTIRAMMRHVGKIDSYVGVEADAANFRHLSRFCSDNHGEIASNILLLPVALSSQTAMLSFSGSLGLCSEISSGHTNSDAVQGIRLDDVLFNEGVTMITMDMEGAEYEAITGAYNLLSQSRPNIGCSVYHRISDLWRLINLFAARQLGYTYFLRNYSGFTYETILYCKRNH